MFQKELVDLGVDRRLEHLPTPSDESVFGNVDTGMNKSQLSYSG
jgi:hypothetical protein